MQPYQHVCVIHPCVSLSPNYFKTEFPENWYEHVTKATSHPQSLFPIITNMTAAQTFKLGLILDISKFVESKKYGGCWKFIYTWSQCKKY
jgi:hypothetical protein